MFNDYSKFENSRQFALDGENLNVNRLIENTKKFFVEENIPHVLNYHFENFDKINKIFTETLKIQMSSTMQEEEADPKVFKEEMFKVIHDSYLSFPAEGMFDFFSGKSQNFYEQSGRNFESKNAYFNANAKYGTGFNPYNYDGDYAGNRAFYGAQVKGFDFDGKLDRNRIRFCFFFGDNKKIKMLIQIIDSKLFLLMKTRLQQQGNINIGKSGFESEYLFSKISLYFII